MSALASEGPHIDKLKTKREIAATIAHQTPYHGRPLDEGKLQGVMLAGIPDFEIAPDARHEVPVGAAAMIPFLAPVWKPRDNLCST